MCSIKNYRSIGTRKSFPGFEKYHFTHDGRPVILIFSFSLILFNFGAEVTVGYSYLLGVPDLVL